MDAGTTSAVPDDEAQRSFYIGVLLAVSSTIFIGASFIIKKKSLIHISKVGGARAAAGGYGYLKDWLWWTGLITMGIGEAANFTAYAFAPASVVTPLGGLSILVSAVLASYFLKERLNLIGKLGCFLCILGSTVIVLHAPHEGEIENLDALFIKLQEPGVLIYCAFVVILAFVLSSYAVPKWGHEHVVVYVLLCASVGSLTVMSCKALGVAVKETLEGHGANNFGNWLTWLLLLVVIVCIMVQMNYLNRALDLFNTGIVTPIYYVLFTTFVIISSAIFFKEWVNMSAVDVVGSLCGFFVVNIAIVLLNTFKDVDVSISDVKGMLRPKRELVGSGIRNCPAHVLHSDEDEDHPFTRHSFAKSGSYGSPGFTNTI